MVGGCDINLAKVGLKWFRQQLAYMGNKKQWSKLRTNKKTPKTQSTSQELINNL